MSGYIKNKKEYPVHVLKLTGLSTYTKNIFLNGVEYQVILSENLICVPMKEHFIKSKFKCANEVLTFYFPSAIVSYFCHRILNVDKYDPKKEKNFFRNFYPLFIDEFIKYINENSKNRFELIGSEVIYEEIDNLLFFQLESKQNRFQIYLKKENDLKFFSIILNDFEFNKIENNSESFDLRNFDSSYAIECGVTYLNKKELENIEVDDIVLLDKLLDREFQEVCINFKNQIFVEANKISPNKLQLMSDLKDW